MYRIPNILSFSRIPLALLLIYIAMLETTPWLWVGVYVITAMTDMFDGLLARKFGWQSEFGAKIDGFADITLVLSMLVVVFFVLRLRFAPFVLAMVLVIAAFRVANLLFMRVKFKQFGTMHTTLIRYTAIPIYIIAPFFVLTGQTLDGWVMLILGAILISVAEETLILMVMPELDMNTKTLWHAWQQRTQYIKKAAPAGS